VAVNTPSTAEMEKMIIEKEKGQWELYKNKQVDDLRKNEAVNYRGAYPDGIKDKDKDAQASLAMDMKSYSVSDFFVTFPNPDTAVMTYKSVVNGSVKGKDASGTNYSSAVWVKEGGEWKSLLYTETRLDPQPKK
jgi:hypothetical protein